LPRNKRPYLRQKPILYFDQNFPRPIIQALRADKRFRKIYKICSVYDLGNEHKDDKFQYDFCKRKGFVLVTLDHDFMDDKKYPIQRIPGIILIVLGRKQLSKIKICLGILTDFLSRVPLPKAFMGDGKFQMSLEGCVLRARDAETREIKTMTIQPGDTIYKVGKKFNYF
jgi:predicted nuclease of predicted toxin-antitoxin system